MGIKEDLESMSIELNDSLHKLSQMRRSLQDQLEMCNKEHVSTLLRWFLLLKEFKEDVESELDQIKALYDTMNSEVVPSALDLMGLQSVKIGDRTFTPTGKMHASVPSSNITAAKAWLSQRGMGHLVKETVNSKTLTSALTEWFETEGETPPSDVITTYTKRAMSVRKNV